MRAKLLSSLAWRLGGILETSGTPACLVDQPCAASTLYPICASAVSKSLVSLCEGKASKLQTYTTRSVAAAGFSRESNNAFGNFPSVSRSYSTLSEIEFQRVADDTLDALQDQLDELLEDISVEDSDVKCDSGVLELILGDKGTYVINKQAPNKQIWLSSPLSGPFRYDYSKELESWVYSRDKHRLEEKLSKELSEILNTAITIKTSQL